MTDPALATIDQVKPKLGILAADTSQDAELTSALAAAQAYVLARTRLSLAPVSVDAEIHENVLEGAVLLSALRPIDTASALTAAGRVLGSDQWSAVVADCVDPNRGMFRIVGVTAALRVFPPPAFPDGLVHRHRRWRWPVLRLGYTTADPGNLDRLADPTAGIAAYLIRTGEAANLALETVGQVTEQYAVLGAGAPVFPPALEAMLVADLPPRARLTS